MWTHLFWTLVTLAWVAELLKEPEKPKPLPYKTKRGVRIEDRISKIYNDFRQSQEKSG